jgi:Flp pilus assembly protein TadD
MLRNQYLGGRTMAGRILISALAAGAVMLVAGAAVASGGGGGGMSEMPSASGPAYDPVAEYQTGVAALRGSDFKTAEKAFGHVLEVNPKDANTLFLMGVTKTGKGDLKAAQKFYEKSVKADPSLVASHRELAVTDLKLAQPDKAKAERDLLQAQADACAGTCAQAADLKAALAAIDAAAAPPAADPASPKPSAQGTPAPSLLFGPRDGDHAYVEAVSLINDGRYEDAIASLKTAAAVFGPHPDVLTYLGYANRKLGRYDLAEGYYLNALKVSPDHRGASEYYGELKVARGDLPGARKLLAHLDDLCPYGCAEAAELRRWVEAGGQP